MALLQPQAGHYTHIGILQCDQWGAPSFLHRAAGGKWGLQQDPSEIGQAALATIGLTIHARAQFDWRDEVGTIVLDTAKAVQPGDLACEHVDLATALILEGHDHER